MELSAPIGKKLTSGDDELKKIAAENVNNIMNQIADLAEEGAAHEGVKLMSGPEALRIFAKSLRGK